MAGRNACWFLLILWLAACSDSNPTAPVMPKVGEGPNSLTVALCASAQLPCQNIAPALQVESVAEVFVVVSFTGGPAPTQAGISTSLGNFGSDNGGNAITQQTLTLAGSGGTRSARVVFNAGTTAGTANLAANVGSVTQSFSLSVTEAPALFLRSVSPNFGPVNGGNSVQITGQGFLGTPRVTFGDVLATVEGTPTSTSLQVVVPQPTAPVPTGQSVVVNVTVTNPPQGTTTPATSDTLSGAYTYTAGSTPIGPTITTVTPGQGPNSGGTQLSIIGTGFPTASANIFVAFGTGASPATFEGRQVIPTLLTPTRIELTTPSAAPDLLNQTIDILVRDLSTGLGVVAPSAFTYGSPSVILDIQPRQVSYQGSPSSCPSSPGDCVTITAQGLPISPMLAVDFGGSFQTTCPSAACQISDPPNSLLIRARSVAVQNCLPPSGPVTVTNQTTGEVGTGPLFTYTAERPAILSAQPNSGAAAGGVLVTLNGTFSLRETSLVVLVGGVTAALQPCTPPTDCTSQRTVTLPPFTGMFNQVPCGNNGMRAAPTAVDVEVRYPVTGCNAVATGVFTYLPDNPACIESPVANFEFMTGVPVSPPDPNCPSPALNVRFTDTSTGAPTSWSWSFGDGSPTSALQNPTHCFASPDLYTVTLTATNAFGSNTIDKPVDLQ